MKRVEKTPIVLDYASPVIPFVFSKRTCCSKDYRSPINENKSIFIMVGNLNRYMILILQN